MTVRNREQTKVIFVHCSATRAKQDIGVRTINEWHLRDGIFAGVRGRSGYHFVLRRSGGIELGRDLPAIGAHALGYNDVSVGVCLVGGARRARKGETPEWNDMMADDNFTPEQMDSLETIVRALLLIYPDAVVAPHNAVSTKACPSFDVWAWQQERFGYNDELRAKKVLAETREEA